MVQIDRLLLPEIEEALDTKDLQGLRRLVENLHPADLLEILKQLPPQKQVILFRILPKGLAREVFGELEPAMAEELLHSFTFEEVHKILRELDPSDRAWLFDELPADVVKKLLEVLTPEERREALEILQYPENSCGRLMNRRFIEGFEWERAGDLAKRAIQSDLPEEVVQEIYILDRQRRVLGSITLLQLLRAPEDTLVSNLILRSPPTVSAWEDQEKAAQLFQKYGLKTLPVIDREGALVGIITIDDILEVIEEEASEDIYRLGGVEGPEIEYPRAGLWEIYRKRIIWLSLLFVSESLTSTVILHYEEYIAKLAVLAAYIPLLIGTGGNVGSQIATLIVRGFATGEIRDSDFWKILAKELAIGMVLGLTMGLFIWLRIVTFRHTPLVAITIGISMVGIATFANLVGTILPFLFRRVGIDPAITSSPFIATMMDVTGLIIYFNIARIILDL